MLRSLREIFGCVIADDDGEVGRCRDFLIDDRTWAVRCMVANTAKWLPRRRVLVAAEFLEHPGCAAQHLPARLTRNQSEPLPPLKGHAAVSWPHEAGSREHYSMPYFWERQ